MFAGLYAKLIGAALAVLAILAAIGRIFYAGKSAARGEQAAKNVEVKNAMDKARADGPHDKSDAVDRLRRRSF